MKFLLLVGVILLAGTTVASGEIESALEEEMKAVINECAQNFNFTAEDATTLKEIKKGVPLAPLSQNAKCFLGCSFKNLDLISDENKPNLEKITGSTFLALADETDDEYKKCAEVIPSGDECEVANSLYKCLEVSKQKL